MKKLIYTLAFLSITLLTSSCKDDDAPLPADYTNVGIETDRINSTLMGEWKKYVITRTTFSNGSENTQTIGNYSGNFVFDDPGSTWNDFIVYNFPYTGTFEVRRYGERLAFYDRSRDQHKNLILSEVSAAKVVFKDHQIIHEDYFIVTTHTLTR